MAYTGSVNSDIANAWAKVHGDMQDGINFVCEEFAALRDDIPGIKLAPSLREITYPVRLGISGGVTSLAESGRLANPTITTPVDATVSFIHKNKRFTISWQAQWALMDAQSREAAIISQLKLQGMDAIDSLSADVADRFWGFSNGVVCTTTTAATQSSGTYALAAGFGVAGITDTTYLAARWVKGDTVALLDGSNNLVSNGIGLITADPTTSGLAITWAGSVASSSGYKLVKANGANATTIAHSSYNKDITGQLDIWTSTSLHGVSGGTYTGWTAAHTDSGGGRFNGVKLRKGFDQIQNFGAGNIKNVNIWASQGVIRDTIAQQAAGLRYENPFALEMDGDVKARGKMFQTSRRVPPGYVVMYVDGAIRKRVLKEADSSGPDWGELYQPQDDAYKIGQVNYALLTACISRKSGAIWSALTEQ